MDPIIDTESLSFFGRIRLSVRRFRNSRGFGVHSPAAFALMKEVVRPARAYGLYSYHPLDCMLESLQLPPGSSRGLRATMRLLLRLSRHINPSSIRILHDGGQTPLPFSRLPELAGKRAAHSIESGMLCVALAPIRDSAVESMRQALKSDCVVVLVDRNAAAPAAILSKEMRGGVIIIRDSLVILRQLPDSALSVYYA